MAKVTVKVKFDSDIFTNSLKEEVGTAIVDEIKNFAAAGQSAVRGEGRFEQYSGQSDPKKYPNNVKGKYPGKKLRPVNLSLSGEYLKSLKAVVKNNSIGISITGAKNLLKFQTHNEGTNPNVPERRILPSRQGESFAVSIERIYIDLMSKIVSDRLRKKK